MEKAGEIATFSLLLIMLGAFPPSFLIVYFYTLCFSNLLMFFDLRCKTEHEAIPVYTVNAHDCCFEKDLCRGDFLRAEQSLL